MTSVAGASGAEDLEPAESAAPSGASTVLVLKRLDGPDPLDSLQPATAPGYSKLILEFDGPFGAAAASMELGFEDRAQRYYESLEMGAGFVSTPHKICVYSTRLYALLSHWQRPDEARAWLERLDDARAERRPRRHRIWPHACDPIRSVRRPLGDGP